MNGSPELGKSRRYVQTESASRLIGISPARMSKRRPVYEMDHMPSVSPARRDGLTLSGVLIAMLFAVVIGIVLGAASAV